MNATTCSYNAIFGEFNSQGIISIYDGVKFFL